MMRAKVATPVPQSKEDIVGFETLEASDQRELEPLLKQFIKDRQAKLNGTLPKKPKKAAAAASPAPKASSKPAAMAADDWFSPSKSSAPKAAPSAAPAAKPVSKDPYGLAHMLDSVWSTLLTPLIGVTPGVEKMLSTFSMNLPNKARLFESLRHLVPSDVKLIVIKDKPYANASASSGYPFNDANATTLAKANEQLSAFMRAARSHSNAQGNLIDWETYNTRKTASWYEAVKLQGTLFLHRELSIDPSYANATTNWEAVVLKIIKSIFVARRDSNKSGVVIVLFGTALDQLKREIQRIHNRFQDKVPVRIVSSPLPDDPDFTSSDSNLFETVDSFLLETENGPINWFPEETPEPAPASAALKKLDSTLVKKDYTEEKFPVAPPMAAKMTSRVQLTSMDGRPNLDLGKLHRNYEGKSGSFLMRSVDLEADNPHLSSHVAVFTMGAKGAISLEVLSTNPIMYCPSGSSTGAAAASHTARALTAGTTVDLKRGDILSFVGEDFTYRIDPYNFAHPPTNRYMPDATASGMNSTNASFMEDDILDARAKEAKRPFDGAHEDDEEALPSAAKKSKPKAKKPAAMDWMDDGEEEEDYEYKPSKHDETAYDHIIDDKGGNSSDEEAAFFADTRPLCMYGSECHQKNPKHIAKYRHPPHTVANPKK